MGLEYEKQVTDARGTIIFLKYGEKSLNLVQIKKGFARGGHYHAFQTRHHLIAGTIEYREKDINTGQEKIQTISGPAIITVPPMAAHLLIAQEDTVFAEEFEKNYSATEYAPYREIVTQKMS
jgi:dTDP-4-dehydrorhamnose 3,5-epimerase-like enzyme